MNEPGRDACRQLFLRLVTLGEGTRGHASPRPAFGARDARRRAGDGRGDRDVRAPPAALVRSRSRHAGADGRDRARGPAPRVGAAARLDRRRAGGSAPAAPGSRRRRSEWIQADRSSDYLLSGIRLAQAEEAGRDDTVRLTETEREFLDASLAHRDAEAAAERMRHERELTLERRPAPACADWWPCWSPAAGRWRASPRRSRSTGAARPSDGATRPRSPPSPLPPCRTSTSTRRSVSCWRCKR